MTKFDQLPGLVREALKMLPKAGDPFSVDARVRWGQLMTTVFQWSYEEPEPIDVAGRRAAAPSADAVFRPLTEPGGQAAVDLDREVVVPLSPDVGDFMAAELAKGWMPLHQRYPSLVGRGDLQASVNDPLLDADAEPFRRRDDVRASGGILQPGTITLIGEEPRGTVVPPTQATATVLVDAIVEDPEAVAQVIRDAVTPRRWPPRIRWDKKTRTWRLKVVRAIGALEWDARLRVLDAMFVEGILIHTATDLIAIERLVRAELDAAGVPDPELTCTYCGDYRTTNPNKLRGHTRWCKVKAPAETVAKLHDLVAGDGCDNPGETFTPNVTPQEDVPTGIVVGSPHDAEVGDDTVPWADPASDPVGDVQAAAEAVHDAVGQRPAPPTDEPLTTEQRRQLLRQEKAEAIIPRWKPPEDPHAGARLGHKRTPTQFEIERARSGAAEAAS